ncbi:hypothetical protein DFA_02098 [Cavenderia fasciculata]|uniref:Uncharacterized protein n=1 Tax=Cavenderia fasciculata TaxID=261658 RepID=F4PYP5_CACFS|nr:uncharacterized protein DFA_02098 [Cavenderia fasciculata]EGG19311.1 hypothetical protein DFA_02098 [Cavenderia fasciculata]|eukprot:XP_004357582.1 hypothetical protein DFA_02098 [Cavenderia fasciculata]
MLTIQVRSNIIRLLCNQNKVKLRDLFYLASVSKQIRNTVKKCVGRRFKLRFNPFNESIQDCRLHIDNPLCLFDHVHTLVSSMSTKLNEHNRDLNIQYIQSNLEWFQSSFINRVESIETGYVQEISLEWFNLLLNQPRRQQVKLTREEGEGEGEGEGSSILLLPQLQSLEMHLYPVISPIVPQPFPQPFITLEILPEYYQHLLQLQIYIYSAGHLAIDKIIKVLEYCKETLERLELFVNDPKTDLALIENPIFLNAQTSLVATGLTNIILDYTLPSTIKKLKLVLPKPMYSTVTSCYLPSLTSLVIVHNDTHRQFHGVLSWDYLAELAKTSPLIRKIKISIFTSSYTKFIDSSNIVHLFDVIINKSIHFNRLIIESFQPTVHSALKDIYLDYLNNNNNNNNNNSSSYPLLLIQKDQQSTFTN